MTYEFKSLQAAEAFMREREGHAVQLDWASDSQGKFLSARVTHFLTCKKCCDAAEIQKRSNADEKQVDGATKV